MPSWRPSHSASQRLEILEKLSEPFDPEEIHWLVQASTPDGSRGMIHAHVRRGAYTERLDEVVGKFGWNLSRTIKTLSGLPRQMGNKRIQSGKIIASCSLTIHGIGTKSESAEHWADHNNATAKADAQALKRACSGFGLGEYLYAFEEIWVPLDAKQRPRMLPELPDWSLPKKYRTGEPRPRLIVVRGRQISGPRLRDVREMERIESFHRFLGDPIYTQLLAKAGHGRTSRTIPTAERQLTVLKSMEKATQMLRGVNSLARRLGNDQVLAAMDRLNLSSARQLPSMETLVQLWDSLVSIERSRAA